MSDKLQLVGTSHSRQLAKILVALAVNSLATHAITNLRIVTIVSYYVNLDGDMSSEKFNNHQRHFLPAAGRDLFLPLYDPLVTLIGGNRSRRDLIDQANITAGQRILDIGCGTGTFLVMLKKQHSDVEAIGLDPDRKALNRARAKAARAGVSIQLDQGFADELPYEAHSFDLVVSSFMFHHLEESNREKTLKEVLRVLKPGASFHLLDFTDHAHNNHTHVPHGLLTRLFHTSDRLKENSDVRIVELMRKSGFQTAEKIKDEQLLFGLLKTSCYRAIKQ